jgi:hypothetical protein
MYISRQSAKSARVPEQIFIMFPQMGRIERIDTQPQGLKERQKDL